MLKNHVSCWFRSVINKAYRSASEPIQAAVKVRAYECEVQLLHCYLRTIPTNHEDRNVEVTVHVYLLLPQGCRPSLD